MLHMETAPTDIFNDSGLDFNERQGSARILEIGGQRLAPSAEGHIRASRGEIATLILTVKSVLRLQLFASFKNVFCVVTHTGSQEELRRPGGLCAQRLALPSCQHA